MLHGENKVSDSWIQCSCTMNLIGKACLFIDQKQTLEARLFIDQKQTLELASAQVIWICPGKIGFLQYEVIWSSLYSLATSSAFPFINLVQGESLCKIYKYWKVNRRTSAFMKYSTAQVKKKQIFFSVRGPILQSAIFRQLVWSKPLRVKKFYSKLCARYSEDIPRTSVYSWYSEYLRVAIDYSV